MNVVPHFYIITMTILCSLFLSFAHVTITSIRTMGKDFRYCSLFPRDNLYVSNGRLLIHKLSRRASLQIFNRNRSVALDPAVLRDRR